MARRIIGSALVAYGSWIEAVGILAFQTWHAFQSAKVPFSGTIATEHEVAALGPGLFTAGFVYLACGALIGIGGFGLLLLRKWGALVALIGLALVSAAEIYDAVATGENNIPLDLIVTVVFAPIAWKFMRQQRAANGT